jgi:hypothetical protein
MTGFLGDYYQEIQTHTLLSAKASVAYEMQNAVKIVVWSNGSIAVPLPQLSISASS